MKFLILASIEGIVPCVREVPEGVDVHQFIWDLNVGGVKPKVHSIIPLPISGDNLFASVSIFADGKNDTIAASFNMNNGATPQIVRVTNLGDYLALVEDLRAYLAAKLKVEVRFLLSLTLF